MAKITIDIDYVKASLTDIGYVISDVIERDNNGINWQIKFNNSGAIVTLYATNTKKNTVVNGKAEEDEKTLLKDIIDNLKCKSLTINPLNKKIVELINSKREGSFYDFKSEWYKKNKNEDFVHDILCLSNNLENQEAYLIIGVDDQYNVVGVEDWRKSNEIFDFIRTIKFAGNHFPEIELLKMYYQYKKIDVLRCKSSKYVPFYLSEKYNGVFDNQIYTRIGDTNTPKTGNANYNDIERLWRIHFERENEPD